MFLIACARYANGTTICCIAYVLNSLRYLSKYEQIETIGDIDDMLDGEMSRSRGRQISFFATNDCPIGMGRSHEYIRRDDRGNPSTEPDYGRLTKSLLSGLPNEVDFAMNVCTLLSHPGPRLLRLSHAPNIITLLVAHCGIFDDEDKDLSDLAEAWHRNGGRDFTSFWASAGIPNDILEKFAPQAVGKKVVDLTWHKMVHCADHTLLRIVREGIFSTDKFKVGFFSSENNAETVLTARGLK
ncbi:hypothetical protein ANCDUO_08780 [Ancylostoma duodenale]|uniref:Uncharacterized protein n=1 Tax=Ancylostoma duodenale TaxID=51022 RepID=A0A0C2GIE1_9BILA|nr:hypothetical protein ANCDUO_08780 [Ancylostoma duodenale]